MKEETEKAKQRIYYEDTDEGRRKVTLEKGESS